MSMYRIIFVEIVRTKADMFMLGSSEHPRQHRKRINETAVWHACLIASTIKCSACWSTSSDKSGSEQPRPSHSHVAFPSVRAIPSDHKRKVQREAQVTCVW